MAYKLSNTKKVNPVTPACNKTIYNSFEEAEETIRYIKQDRMVQKLSAYKCTICGFWHLTSKSK